ncbi:hypothetical protein EV421DRAFT_1914039 [Armillaria borealis]|uniref:Uncharacterized protein n=1 Tax=Armillaria borealis TaxID=47425 RepID=A0AA39ISS6_9AGAR|nr:hypothetical protein EV421DRAFT_1914039 [Armillaria borealis]
MPVSFALYIPLSFSVRILLHGLFTSASALRISFVLTLPPLFFTNTTKHYASAMSPSLNNCDFTGIYLLTTCL